MSDQINSMRCSRRAVLSTLVGVLVFAVIGFAMVIAATHRGVGLSPDSTAYEQGARFIAEGKGFLNYNTQLELKPQTHFAPLYSVVLAGFVRAGVKLDQGSRLLNGALFSVNCVLVGLMLSRCVDRSRARCACVAGVALTAFSTTLIDVHSMVWSEPLFLTAMLGCFLMVGFFIDGGGRIWLIAGAAAAAIGFLTRYAGVSVLISVAVALVARAFSDRKWGRRIMDAVLFLFVAGLPMIGWFIRNLVRTGHSTNRDVAFHPPLASDWNMGMQSLADWVLPPISSSSALGIVGTVIVLILTIVVFCLLLRKPRDLQASNRRGTLNLLLWFAPLYTIFILASITWVDASTELDFRILCPLYLVMLSLAIVAFFTLSDGLHTAGAQRAVVMIGVLIVLFQAGRSAAWANTTCAHGLGYSNRTWRSSELLKYAKTLPAHAVIYTNAPDALYLCDGLLAKPIPKMQAPGSREELEATRYMTRMRKDLGRNHGYLLYFKDIGRAYLVSEDKLHKDLALYELFRGKDGIAFIPESSAPGSWLRAMSAATAPSTGPSTK